jgi:Flp pilus assembly pilin Flp
MPDHLAWAGHQSPTRPATMQVTIDAETYRQTKENTDMTHLMLRLWTDDKGQDIAEYAVMLAVILVIVIGTVRLVGSHANTVFSNVASSIQ